MNQHEIGIDTPNFKKARRAVLRQKPDIILIGEMRDADTFETSISAAETGHLLFNTLHAASAQQAIIRLFEYFPLNKHEQAGASFLIPRGELSCKSYCAR